MWTDLRRTDRPGDPVEEHVFRASVAGNGTKAATSRVITRLRSTRRTGRMEEWRPQGALRAREQRSEDPLAWYAEVA
jgi:hypothetical protein